MIGSPQSSRPRSFRPRGYSALSSLLLLGNLFGLGAGCGGAASAGQGPDSELTTLAGAEAELASAESELQRSFGDRAVPDATGAGAEQLDAAPPAPQPAPAPPSEPSPDRPSGDACETACRALGSMRRAADRICALAADRCEDANARLSRAERRVFDACPGCSG